MTQELSAEGQKLVDDAAQRHGFSSGAVRNVLGALAASGGSQAQFNHPDLGGMGQWSRGGMIMIGDMFNNGLKARVDALCNDLAGAVRDISPFAPAPASSQSQSQSSGAGWSTQSSGPENGTSFFVSGPAASRWPAELGSPSSTGSQNDLHYAIFPGTRRLAIEKGGQLSIYDTGDHRISGFSQQQSGDQSLTFTSQHGLVKVRDLKEIDLNAEPRERSESDGAPKAESPAGRDTAAIAPPPASQPSDSPASGSPQATGAGADRAEADVFAQIERLAELRRKDIITAAEFDAKKAELLSRI